MLHFTLRCDILLQVEVYANQSTGNPVNITVIHNELYGELFALIDNILWNTVPLDREHQDGYNLIVIAYGSAGVTTANVSREAFMLVFNVLRFGLEWLH